MAEFLCCFFPQHVVACFPDNTASLGEKERKAWNSNKYQSSTAILIPFFILLHAAPYASEKISVKSRRAVQLSC